MERKKDLESEKEQKGEKSLRDIRAREGQSSSTSEESVWYIPRQIRRNGEKKEERRGEKTSLPRIDNGRTNRFAPLDTADEEASEESALGPRTD